MLSTDAIREHRSLCILVQSNVRFYFQKSYRPKNYFIINRTYIETSNWFALLLELDQHYETPFIFVVIMMNIENSNAGIVQKQSSVPTADPGEEETDPAKDQSQISQSQNSRPKKVEEPDETDRLEQILWHQYFEDDETEGNFNELRATTKKLIQGSSRTSALGNAISSATRWGLKRSTEIMINEIEMVAKKDLHGIVNWHDKSLTNWTPLHMACVWGRLDFIQLLLDHEANREEGDEDLKTPLHVACYYGEPEIVALLLKEEANILAQDNKNQTPLIVAIRERETSCMKELLKIKLQRKQRYKPDKDDKSALQWAIEDGFTQGVVEMFEDPSDYPNDEDVRKAANEVLTYAVCTEDDLNDQVEKVVNFLVQEKLSLPKHPEDPDNRDAFLSWAAERHSRHSIAKQLLQLESRGPTDISAIEMAARQRKPKILWSLIAASPRDSGTIN